jgi:hypothetical protein
VRLQVRFTWLTVSGSGSSIIASNAAVLSVQVTAAGADNEGSGDAHQIGGAINGKYERTCCVGSHGSNDGHTDSAIADFTFHEPLFQ